MITENTHISQRERETKSVFSSYHSEMTKRQNRTGNSDTFHLWFNKHTHADTQIESMYSLVNSDHTDRIVTRHTRWDACDRCLNAQAKAKGHADARILSF